MKDEILAILGKTWVWFCLILLGWVGKVCYHVYMRRKVSWLWVLSSLGIALFIGFLAHVWCAKHYPDREGLIVPIASLMSDKILLALFSLDWKGIMHDIIKRLFGGSK